MSDSAIIDRNSKLYQRFLLTKNITNTIPTLTTTTHTVQNIDSSPSKENQSMNINRLQPHFAVQPPKMRVVEKKEENVSLGRVVAADVNVSRCANNNKWGGNPLNIDSNMGLDKILKRAIEKVRNSKMQELVNNVDPPMMQHDDSLEQLKKNNKTRTEPQIKQETPQRLEYEKSQQKQTEQDMLEYSRFSLTAKKKQNQDKSHPSNSPKPSVDQTSTAQITYWKQLCHEKTVMLEQSHKKISTLQLQNQRLKRQITTQIDDKTDLQHQRQQLLAQLRQSDAMLQAKEVKLKKYADDANYWRNQNEILNVNIDMMKETVEILEKKVEKLTEENQKLKEEKMGRVEELEEKIERQEEENKLAKHYLYQMTIKMYQYEQEIMQLKGTKCHEHSNQRMQSMPQEPEQQPVETINMSMNQSAVVPSPCQPRKRQFSRQRSSSALVKPTAQCSPRPHASSPQHLPTLQTDTARQARIAAIQTQLTQLQQLKIVNGKIRRRKIQLQRQLHQLTL